VKVEDLDRLVEDALREDADRARLDTGRWRPTVGGGPRRRFRGFPPVVRRSAVAAIAAAVVIAGIAVPLAILSQLRGDVPVGVGASQDPQDLWGREFLSVGVTESGQPRPLVPDTRIRVGFGDRDGTMGWSAGCNSLGARVEITADRLLVKGDVWSTLIGCPEPLADQEEWLHRFFLDGPYWRLDASSLTLTSGETVIELEERGTRDREISPFPPEDCPQGGPWSHPACPAPAWVRDVVDEAGFHVTGDTGSALIAEGPDASFYIHTTERDDPSMAAFVDSLRAEGYEPYPLDYYPVLTDGTRFVWKVDGLAVWLTDNLEPVSPTVVDRVVAASLRVDYRQSEATA
jgi:heat shock protein HslJ